jgi:hypothetical protein
MKRRFVLSVMAACIWATSARSATKPVFPKLEASAIANFGPGCRIKVGQPATATFPFISGTEPNLGGGTLVLQDLRFMPGTWFFGLGCYQVGDGQVREGWAVPSSDGKWRLNDDEATRQLLPLGALRFYELNSRNSRGWAVAVDDISGNERSRQGELFYCLVRGPKAICGGGYMGNLRDFRRHKDADFDSAHPRSASQH